MKAIVLISIVIIYLNLYLIFWLINKNKLMDYFNLFMNPLNSLELIKEFFLETRVLGFLLTVLGFSYIYLELFFWS